MLATSSLYKQRPSPFSAFALLALSCASGAASAQPLPPLPAPTSNQVVLSTTITGKTYVGSFLGIGEEKTPGAVHNHAWQWTVGDAIWQRIPAVPSRARLTGRVGASGVAMNSHFFLFGGYTISETGVETASTESYRYSPVTRLYTKLNDMPVAVNDAVALSYQNRYIYLATGWSQDGAVNLMQLFDNFTQKWTQATPFPGLPTFGLAGAITGSVLVLCDGALANYQAKTRVYETKAQCWRGDISQSDASKISWQELPHPTGQARFRFAGADVNIAGSTYLAFLGGSESPHNFRGLDATQKPVSPSDEIWLFNPTNNEWRLAKSETPVMDLRSLVRLDGELYSLGGMLSAQQVTNQWIHHQIKLLPTP